MLVGLFLTTFSQEMPKNDDGNYEYSEVVEVPGATKEQVFRTSRSWFVDQYNKKTQGSNVIYTDDSFLGEMAASPLLFVQVHSMGKNTGGGSVSYNISISSKEGKYKYTIGNFYHESNRSMICSGGELESDTPDCEGGQMNEVIWNEIKQDTRSKIESIVEDLKETMAEAATNSEDDW